MDALRVLRILISFEKNALLCCLPNSKDKRIWYIFVRFGVLSWFFENICGLIIVCTWNSLRASKWQIDNSLIISLFSLMNVLFTSFLTYVSAFNVSPCFIYCFTFLIAIILQFLLFPFSVRNFSCHCTSLPISWEYGHIFFKGNTIQRYYYLTQYQSDSPIYYLQNILVYRLFCI